MLYQKMYYQLFNRVTDALALLDAGKVKAAVRLLELAQREAEETYVKGGS